MLPMKTTKVKKLRKSKSYRCPRCDARRKPAYTCTECGGRVGKCCISDISLGIVTCIYCEKAVKQGVPWKLVPTRWKLVGAPFVSDEVQE